MKTSILDLIKDYQHGKMIILLDDEGRENEGDLMVAANKITPYIINFMATHGRGLICLTLSKSKCQQLNLPLMVGGNNTNNSTNFTLSVDAATGITTGISAKDRAMTIKTIIKDSVNPNDITVPGHMFPLMARDGGVLTRAGHTEAGCDLAKLAGFEPASVIVEILNDDGTMARRDDIEIFAKKHNIRWGVIEDLISHRLINEKTVKKISSERFSSIYGHFKKIVYRDTIDNNEHIALIGGDITTITNVRVQMQNINYDILDNISLLKVGKILNYIYKYSGVFLLLNKNNKAQDDNKTFGIGAQILADMGVSQMNLIGKTIYKSNTFRAFGLTVNKNINLD